VRREFPVSRANIEEGWVVDSRLTRLPLAPDSVPPLFQVALDTKGRAVGDPPGLAFSGDGKRLGRTGSGTHELPRFATAAIPWNGGDPGDALDPRIAGDESKFRRLAVGGRPLTVACRGDEVVVANYLLDAVQVVDGGSGKLVRSVPLGGPAEPSPA